MAKALKSVDVVYSGFPFAVLPTDGGYLVNSIQLGSRAWNRVGRSVRLRHFTFDGFVAFEPDAVLSIVPAAILRVVLVWDRQFNGVVPSYGDVFYGVDEYGVKRTSVLARLNLANEDRFEILHDDLRYFPGQNASNLRFTGIITSDTTTTVPTFTSVQTVPPSLVEAVTAPVDTTLPSFAISGSLGTTGMTMAGDIVPPEWSGLATPEAGTVALAATMTDPVVFSTAEATTSISVPEVVINDVTPEVVVPSFTTSAMSSFDAVMFTPQQVQLTPEDFMFEFDVLLNKVSTYVDDKGPPVTSSVTTGGLVLFFFSSQPAGGSCSVTFNSRLTFND